MRCPGPSLFRRNRRGAVAGRAYSSKEAMRSSVAAKDSSYVAAAAVCAGLVAVLADLPAAEVVT